MSAKNGQQLRPNDKDVKRGPVVIDDLDHHRSAEGFGHDHRGARRPDPHTPSECERSVERAGCGGTTRLRHAAAIAVTPESWTHSSYRFGMCR
jgi:hypothetical protein